MSKVFFWLALAILLASLLLLFFLRFTAPEETSTIRFKEAVAEVRLPSGEVVRTDELIGKVAKKDRYVVVKTEDDGREFVFTWDQIKSISEARQVRSKQVEDVVEWIEFVSKLGIVAAGIVFWVGLYQYQQGQKWMKEQFLAGAVKEFMDSKPADNARLMLDTLRLYNEGIDIRFDHSRDDPPVTVKKEEILAALNPKIKQGGQKVIRIRECFDDYFNLLERFEHYIQTGLVPKDSVYTYINYQINLLSEGGPLDPGQRAWVLYYAEYFDFDRVKDLLKRYDKRVRKERAARRPAPPPAPDDGGAAPGGDPKAGARP